MTGLATIKSLIPHRYPLLLLDDVLELEQGSHVVAVKAVTCNEPCFRRAPEDTAPTYSPALVVESWCQAALLLAMLERPDARDGREVAVFGGATNITVHGDVRPGDVLRHEVRIGRSFGDSWLFEGGTSVGDRPVLTVERVLAATRPSSVLSAAS